MVISYQPAVDHLQVLESIYSYVLVPLSFGHRRIHVIHINQLIINDIIDV